MMMRHGYSDQHHDRSVDTTAPRSGNTVESTCVTNHHGGSERDRIVKVGMDPSSIGTTTSTSASATTPSRSFYGNDPRDDQYIDDDDDVRRRRRRVNKEVENYSNDGYYDDHSVHHRASETRKQFRSRDPINGEQQNTIHRPLKLQRRGYDTRGCIQEAGRANHGHWDMDASWKCSECHMWNTNTNGSRFCIHCNSVAHFPPERVRKVFSDEPHESGNVNVTFRRSVTQGHPTATTTETETAVAPGGMDDNILNMDYRNKDGELSWHSERTERIDNLSNHRDSGWVDDDCDEEGEVGEVVDEFGRAIRKGMALQQNKNPRHSASSRGTRKAAAEWPPAFGMRHGTSSSVDGDDYVLDPRSGMFYHAATDFFYDPKSKLYYGNKKQSYYRLVPPPALNDRMREIATGVFELVDVNAATPSTTAAGTGDREVPTSGGMGGAGTSDVTVPPLIITAATDLSAPVDPAVAQLLGGIQNQSKKKKGNELLGTHTGAGIAIKLKTKSFKKSAAEKSQSLKNDRTTGCSHSKASNHAPDGTASVPNEGVDVPKHHQANIAKWSERQSEMRQDAMATPASSKQGPLPGVPGISSTIITTATRGIARTAKGEPMCLLCRRKFPTVEKLQHHERVSALHKENLAKKQLPDQQQQPGSLADTSSPFLPCDVEGAAGTHSGSTTVYVDRAQQRRTLHGSDLLMNPAAVSVPLAGVSVATTTAAVDEWPPPPPSQDNLGEHNIGHRMLQKQGWKGGSELDGDPEGRPATLNASTRLKEDWERIERMAAFNSSSGYSRRK